MKKYLIPLIVAATLSACSDGAKESSETNLSKLDRAGSKEVKKTNPREELISNIRGVDFNKNGVRDSIERKTDSMSKGIMKDRLRLIAYAWSIQQAIELAAVTDGPQIKKAAQIIADTTACAMSISDYDIAQNLVDIYNYTIDSSDRLIAWGKFKQVLGSESPVPSDLPCSLSDRISVNILTQSQEELKKYADKMQEEILSKNPERSIYFEKDENQTFNLIDDGVNQGSNLNPDITDKSEGEKPLDTDKSDSVEQTSTPVN